MLIMMLEVLVKHMTQECVSDIALSDSLSIFLTSMEPPPPSTPPTPLHKSLHKTQILLILTNSVFDPDSDRCSFSPIGGRQHAYVNIDMWTVLRKEIKETGVSSDDLH